MRREVKLALLLATVSGVVAASVTYDANRFFGASTEPAADDSINLTTVVVAKEALEFGAALTKFKLNEAKWPAASVPAGSFRSIQELFAEQLNRSALIRVEAGEPVLKSKITGPGQRASLSAMLVGGKKAVSIKVNDVIGVSGFVLPGDRVDILMTRSNRNNDDTTGAPSKSYSDVLLQDVRVLAVDQSADSKLEKPVVGRTVTVEVTLEQAQKIALGTAVGELSLVLREEGAMASFANSRRMTVADLFGDSGDKAGVATFEPTIAVAPAPAAVAPQPTRPATVTVNIVRTGVMSEYLVKRSTPSN